MKLLLVSSDMSWSQRIADEARVQGLLPSTTSLKSIQESGIPRSDVVLFETSDVNETLNWWNQQRSGDATVILVAPQFHDDEIVRALEFDIQDCLAKNTSQKVVCAKVKFYGRRNQDMTSSQRHIDRFDLLIDSDHYVVQLKGSTIELTLTEFKILRELARDDEKVISRGEIQEKVFGQINVSNRSMDVHICALRKKVRPFGVDVESVRGVGYRLCPFAAK